MSTGQAWLTNTLGVTMWSPALPCAARGGPAAGEVSAVRRCEGRRGAGQGQGAGIPLERLFRRAHAWHHPAGNHHHARDQLHHHPGHDDHYRVRQLGALHREAGRPVPAPGEGSDRQGAGGTTPRRPSISPPTTSSTPRRSRWRRPLAPRPMSLPSPPTARSPSPTTWRLATGM